MGLLGGQLPNPGGAIADHHHFLGSMVAVLVSQCPQHRGEGVYVAQCGDISAGTNATVFTVLVLMGLINHAALALRVPARQGTLALVFLPGVTQRDEHAVQANVESSGNGKKRAGWFG